MKINNLLKMFVGALVMTFIISSCADDFTEEDLLQAQYDLAQQQEDRENAREDSIDNAGKQAAVDALNRAGQLLDFSVTVATDEAGVEGVTISATNQAGETASATTDANGNITFTDIQMGGHTIKMSSADHVDLSFEIDFGVPERGVHYEIIDGQVIPIETSESARITAIPLTGMLTSTVKGKVTFESDVTNDSPEIPQGVTIRANLTNASNIVSTTNNNASFSGSNSSATSITFTQANIGSAEVDGTTGDYLMTLPAVPGLGLTYDFLVPNLEADATVAYSSTDGGQTTVEGGVAVGTFPAVFGESAATTGGSDNVYTTNTYSSLRAVFSEPAPQGAGFTLDVAGTFQRSLTAGDYDFPVETIGGIRIRTTQGAGYQSSPVATITGGGRVAPEDSAEAKVGMEWRNTGATLAINNAGEGYIVGDVFDIEIRRVDGDGNDVPLAGVAQVSAEVTAVNGTGGITGIDIDDLPTTGDFWDTWDDLGTNEVASIRGFEDDFTNPGGDEDATFTVTYTGRLTDLDIETGGEGYDSAPTITLTGGDATTAATAVIEAMEFQYRFTPSATVTTPYVLLPEDIYFAYTEFVTDDRFVEAPEPIVVNAKHEAASADIDLVDGEFDDFSNIVAGTGYTEPVTVTFQNLDGTVASDVEVTLTGFDTNSDDLEIEWSEDFIIVNGGSGYTDDVNDSGALVGNNLPIGIGAPENGTTIIRNINYGPGFLLDDRVQ
ncbi:hypothetical protein SAMN05661096_03466 [Marivirga sericea]|uniref:Carboxypeptidase regulatory-like domain-containing protein n=1 Tax=Marivirga sericea TaxID=1028 RepID=A0A1X7L3J5_9BACT|nr:hypothetical protein [Marivirga sericea]SMG48441.1 hypothetical protein SAMN05661096_03466 [Marivirga sericea]